MEYLTFGKSEAIIEISEKFNDFKLTLRNDGVGAEYSFALSALDQVKANLNEDTIKRVIKDVENSFTWGEQKKAFENNLL